MRLYAIKNWVENFENNRTRELKRLDWVPVPNRLDNDGYTELIDHPNGAAHFGVWIACVEVASRCEPRGTLLRRSNFAHDFASLSRQTRMPVSILTEAFDRLIAIGWIEVQELSESTDAEIPHNPAVIPHPVAATPHDVAVSPPLACACAHAGAHAQARSPNERREGNGREEKEQKENSARAPGDEISAMADGDKLDDEVRVYFANHPKLAYSPKAHSQVRQLVTHKGWEWTKAEIIDCITQGASSPTGMALSRLNNPRAAPPDNSIAARAARLVAESHTGKEEAKRKAMVGT